jgi:hypothetical protein
MKRFNLMLLAAATGLLILAGCKKDSLVTPQNQTEIPLAKKSGGSTTSTPPVVSFIYPANGDVVTGTITVQVAASSAVGIKNTSLMITVGTSNCLFGNDATAPYEFIWDTNFNCVSKIASGTQVKLRATATDTKGVISYSDIIVTKQ